MIASYRARTIVWHQVLCVQDVGRFADDAAGERARVLAHTDVVTATPRQLFIGVGQTIVAVDLRLEIWPRDPGPAPEPGPEALPMAYWDASWLGRVECPSGRLRFDNTTDGPVEWSPGGRPEVALPPGTKVARILVHARDRDFVGPAALEILTECPDTPDALRTERLRALDGQERYLVRIWPAEGP